MSSRPLGPRSVGTRDSSRLDDRRAPDGGSDRRGYAVMFPEYRGHPATLLKAESASTGCLIRRLRPPASRASLLSTHLSERRPSRPRLPCGRAACVPSIRCIGGSSRRARGSEGTCEANSTH